MNQQSQTDHQQTKLARSEANNRYRRLQHLPHPSLTMPNSADAMVRRSGSSSMVDPLLEGGQTVKKRSPTRLSGMDEAPVSPEPAAQDRSQYMGVKLTALAILLSVAAMWSLCGRGGTILGGGTLSSAVPMPAFDSSRALSCPDAGTISACWPCRLSA